MKDFLKFNIYGINSDGIMIIHHIMSTFKTTTHAGISNVKINLGNMKMKHFDNDVILANEQLKV